MGWLEVTEGSRPEGGQGPGAQSPRRRSDECEEGRKGWNVEAEGSERSRPP